MLLGLSLLHVRSGLEESKVYAKDLIKELEAALKQHGNHEVRVRIEPVTYDIDVDVSLRKDSMVFVVDHKFDYICIKSQEE